MAYGQPYQTKNIDGMSGLYFEDAGKIFFYSYEWKIVSNVNLTKYQNELKNIRHVVEVIRNHCEELKLIEMEKNASLKGNEGCGPALLKLNFVMADIDENDSLWLEEDRRAKRNVFSDLFSDDWSNEHSTFLNEFTNMCAQGMETSTSTDNQTSFIVSTLNSVGKWKLSENQTSIYAYITNQLSQVHSTLVAARNGSANAVRMFQLRTTIPDIITYQLLILNNFASKQQQLINIMALVGVTNAPAPAILPTPILLAELNNIRSIAIETGLGFPVQLTSENVYFLLQYSSPEISLYGDQIFVTFKLPLISKLSGNYFTLYKITSVMHNVGGPIYSFVIPNHEVIAIDAHKEHYVTLTIDDLNKCRQIGNETVTLCKQISPPMFVRTSTECEIVTLFNVEIPKWCNERYVRNYADIFIKVMQPNTWLVTMTKRSKVRYLCEGKDVYETMTQINGLLTIDSNCKLFTDDAVIVGDNTLPKRLIREHQIGSLVKDQQLNETFGLETNEYFTSNHVVQVIGFGETEKLSRISYSRHHVKNMKSLIKRIDKVGDKIPSIYLIIPYVLGCIFLFFSCVIALESFCRMVVESRKRGSVQSSIITTQLSAPSVNTQPSAPALPTKPSV